VTWLLRLLLFVVLYLIARSIVSRFLGHRTTSTGRHNRAPGASPFAPRSVGSATVKDPQCGTYVDTTLALPLKADGKTVYFCSEECRRLYESGRVEKVH